MVDTNLDGWDPRLGTDVESLALTEDLKEPRIELLAYQLKKIGTSLTEEEDCEIINRLIKNVNLFSWAPSDMPRINTKVMSHRLTIHPSTKLVAHRRQKVGEEKRVAIEEEVGKISYVGFITETKYHA